MKRGLTIGWEKEFLMIFKSMLQKINKFEGNHLFMKKHFFLLLLTAFFSSAQGLIRIQPEHVSNIFNFGGAGSFNDSQIAVMGLDGIPPLGIPKLYLFDQNSLGITPNGTLSSPEETQRYSGSIEMTEDYLLAGSTSNNTNVTNGGAVFVYKKVNNSWEYLIKIQPTTQYENDYFGSNIKVHNNQLFITASGYRINADSTTSEGAIYVYNISNDTFSFQQILTGSQGSSGLGNVLEIEDEMLVTTVTTSASDSVYVFKNLNSTWQWVNTSEIPEVNFVYNPELSVPHYHRMSFSDGKMYLYHITDDENDLFGQKMIKIYDWNNVQQEWNFNQDFVFSEGDYHEYKVVVRGNNMFLIPTGGYILMMERKNPVFHFISINGNWVYINAYTGMSSYTHDNFAHFTLIKENKVLFGNSMEYWTHPVMVPNGGAYMLDATLRINEFKNTKFVIYPNPTNGILYFYTENNPISSVEIYNDMGKKILEVNTDTASIDISNLNAGVYFCRMMTSDNIVEFQKIIKK